jgi:hypothetical protein
VPAPRKAVPDEIRPLLGIEPDKELARRAGVSVDTVAEWRKRLGIAPAKRGASRTPTPTPMRTPAPPATDAVSELGPVAYLELQLQELRDAEREANGIAFAQLKKQERQVYAELVVARKTERDRVAAESKKKAGPDDLLRQAIIPRALKMSRPHREALYSALGASLGVGAELEQDSVEP